MVEHVGHRAVLDDAPGIHHGDLVGQARHHGEVVADPDQRGAGLAHQLLHFREDLRLDRHVQRGGRLVRNDQVGPVQHRNGNCHALAHAARELVRIGAQPLLRARDAHQPQRVARMAACFFGGDALVRLHRLDHLRVDPQHRVERGHRVLEDHRDAVAPQFAPLDRRQLREFAALEQHLAALDFSRRIDQAHDRETRDRLARARLAHQPQHLAAPQRKGHAVDHRQHAGARVKARLQVAHLERRHLEVLHGNGAHFCNLGLSTSRNWSPTRLIATMAASRATPGKKLIQYSLDSRYW